MVKNFDTTTDWLRFDRDHLWHPYTSMGSPLPTYPAVATNGVFIQLADGTQLIDGMASWWTAIHGYNHPVLMRAARDQLDRMPHVMFGGLAHETASRLGQQLIDIAPVGLDHIFFSDSGSVAVQVGAKMALQFWYGQHQTKRSQFLTVAGGYHGDPFFPMSITDPTNGMHSMFRQALPNQIFVDRPSIAFDGQWDGAAVEPLRRAIAQHHTKLAAVIVEPIVQGAGGMWFYHPNYLAELRRMCDEVGVLLIFDEIATGFGRTGLMFAAEHANVAPDIMCVGKALTGGVMSLAATLCSADVAATIDRSPARVLMHGPTFMANPLACRVASASVELLVSSDWSAEVDRINAGLVAGLGPLSEESNVVDVRVLGAIGVVELDSPIDVAAVQARFVDAGVWVRPFGRLVYMMPPYVISDCQLGTLCEAVTRVVRSLGPQDGLA